LVQTVEEFRRRNLPVDVIVQDWQYWGKYGWGVPKFDEANYPNPDQFIKKLHDLKAGEHTVQVVCKSTNKPSLSWRFANSETTFRSPNAKAFKIDNTTMVGKAVSRLICHYFTLIFPWANWAFAHRIR
jgi:hypothetical protein